MAGRKRKGTLIKTASGYSARIAGGKSIRLHTADPKLAAILLAELVAERPARPNPDQELFHQACSRICDYLKRDGMRTADERLSRLRRYAWPALGCLKVTGIRSGQISAVLETARDAGLAHDTVKHLQVDLSKVFGELVRDEVLEYNPAKLERVRMPKIPKDKRKRVLLTDAEFELFFSAHIPVLPMPALYRPQGGRPVDPARQVVSRRQLAIMALVSRCFGGLRPSDIHAWVWTDVDLVGWMWADAPRPKTECHGADDDTDAPRERLELPPVVARTLHNWWVQQGNPADGPVFPAQKPSYAKDLRRALLEAGVTRAELHADGPRTRQTDFYSFRRAFVTAVGKQGLNAQTAMRVSGHKSMTTHQRYNLPDVLSIPEAALPQFKLGPATPTAQTEN